ncbi:hypothetical protein OG824_12930 [Streptomyces prunicolor]|uniref:hypothetical protein n=1 Tax=Streptomyces prunicolor TaxID=67348 RepID=UPI00224F322F|nr:hypothetical protein [Streptomyces prunicolor]MCX5236105.1 hypothetical protein [Streptomyces prunicolor]
MDTSTEDPVDLTMTAEVYGVLREHAWIGQVGADHDLDADLFGPAVKRAAAYGWSSTRFSAGAELGGQRWGHADAGGDWSQDGRVRQLAWLTVYPATDLREQHLPVLPLTRVMVDSLGRVGELAFTGLTVRVPMRLAPDTRFDLRELVVQRGHGQLRAEHVEHVEHRAGARDRTAFVCALPEWTPDAAAWLAEVFIDALRAVGVRDTAEIALVRNSRTPPHTAGVTAP